MRYSRKRTFILISFILLFFLSGCTTFASDQVKLKFIDLMERPLSKKQVILSWTNGSVCDSAPCFIDPQSEIFYTNENGIIEVPKSILIPGIDRVFTLKIDGYELPDSYSSEILNNNTSEFISKLCKIKSIDSFG